MFHDESVEYPRQIVEMTYTVHPELSWKELDGNPMKTYGICSSMYVELPAEPIEWYMVFHEKMMEDVEVKLI